MPTRRLSRRDFLRLALGGGAALALDGCGRALVPPSATAPGATPTASALAATARPGGATPSATSTGSTINLPVVQAPGGATATATASATATATPSATASATGTAAPPTGTPVPVTTPFPPGPPTKLGIFVGYQHPAMERMLRTGNLPFIKTLEYDPTLMAFIKRISPGTLIVSRYTPLPDLDLSGRTDTIAEARRFVELLRPIALEPQRRANIDYWESVNEPIANTRDEMARLADYEAERTRLLAADGIRSCIGNFATGTPPLALWPAFFPALQAAKEHGGILGLHEYSAPTMSFGAGAEQLTPGSDEGDEGWLTLRYRKVYRQHLQPNGLDIPLVITETGIDGGIRERPGPVGFGWRDFEGYWREQGLIRSTAAGFYAEQLAWYDSELVKDEYVLGASIYALAAPVGWGSFEIIGDVADILTQYLSVHPAR